MSNNGNGSKSPVFELEQAILDHLGEELDRALELRLEGKSAEAEKVLHDILETEPRLAEPRLELAHIFLEHRNLEEAENQARWAVELLRSYGPWTFELTGKQLLSYALTMHAEVLSTILDSDKEALEKPETLIAQWNEVAALFAEASELDPENQAAADATKRYRPIETS